MHFDDIHLAGNLARERARLLHLRDGCKLSAQLTCRGGLGGTHETLDPPIIDQLMPIVRAELDRRLAVVDADLVAIGVEVPLIGQAAPTATP